MNSIKILPLLLCLTIAALGQKKPEPTEKTGPDAPTARYHPAMAFDAARRTIVLFGGGVGGGTALAPQAFNDTWEWNGAVWTPLGK